MIFWRFQTVNDRIRAEVDAAGTRVYTVLGAVSNRADINPKLRKICRRSAQLAKTAKNLQHPL